MTTPYRRPSVRVLIAGQHDVVRAGLRGLIADQPDYIIVGEATDGPQTVAMVGGLHPHVILMDLEVSGLDGIEAIKQVVGRYPAPAVVIVSMGHDVDLVMAALRAGARGYVLLDVCQTELIAVIERALAGGHAIEAAFATELLLQLANRTPAERSRAPEPLTARETEILQLITMGKTNPEIAERLIVAVGTVKIHVEHILGKLGVAGRTQAAVRAVELGLTGQEAVSEADRGVVLHQR